MLILFLFIYDWKVLYSFLYIFLIFTDILFTTLRSVSMHNTRINSIIANYGNGWFVKRCHVEN